MPSLKGKSGRLDSVVERTVQLYGDLLFDFCQSVLWSPANAQLAFRAILKEIRRSRQANGYVAHERAWIMRIACARLAALSGRLGRKLSPSEQIMLDASLASEARLGQFESYFHRLPIDQQMLLLLRDKYGLPYSEISAALALPEGSLKIKRQQALRTLEEWIWDRQ